MQRSSLTNKIDRVISDSVAAALDLHPGDAIVAVNHATVGDMLDFQFHTAAGVSSLLVDRAGELTEFDLELDDDEDLGIVLEPMLFRSCGNRCIFCFVDQQPRGMRRSLYFKDEDYRLSFLYGNYITLTNVDAGDLERIVQQHLAPLYISVHATNTRLRRTILGNPNAPPILPIMHHLADHGIAMHAQLVLMPGLNDGEHLVETLNDLHGLLPTLASIAVIPVGLTMHRRHLTPLTAPTDAWAREVLSILEQHQEQWRRGGNEQVIQAADEMFLLADRPMPEIARYGELPQLTNGVGLLSLFLSELRELLNDPGIPECRIRNATLITGTGAAAYLTQAVADINRRLSVNLSVLPVVNRTFGMSVTVAGLLTGGDIITEILERRPHPPLLIPDCCMKGDEDLFLDDLTPDDVMTRTGLEVQICEATAAGLLRGLGCLQ
ncbi:DUF512 domain-containing protein [bacterium]|nr:DUF512 domain-containing protein [candidate division CSSED10-310 bacterium]